MKHGYKPYDSRQIVFCKDTNERVSGDNYLQSQHWKNLRIKIFNKYNVECQKCHSIIPINKAHIHHITYKRFGNEKESDLVLYCNNCHTAVHNQKRRCKEINKSLRTYINMLDDNEKQEVINYITKKYDL